MCNKVGKPVILMHQIMETMISNPRPSISEIQDVANTIKDGFDCVILGPETAIGQYYKEACKIIEKICLESEKNIQYE